MAKTAHRQRSFHFYNNGKLQFLLFNFQKYVKSSLRCLFRLRIYNLKNAHLRDYQMTNNTIMKSWNGGEGGRVLLSKQIASWKYSIKLIFFKRTQIERILCPGLMQSRGWYSRKEHNIGKSFILIKKYPYVLTESKNKLAVHELASGRARLAFWRNKYIHDANVICLSNYFS